MYLYPEAASAAAGAANGAFWASLSLVFAALLLGKMLAHGSSPLRPLTFARSSSTSKTCQSVHGSFPDFVSACARHALWRRELEMHTQVARGCRCVVCHACVHTSSVQLGAASR